MDALGELLDGGDGGLGLLELAADEFVDVADVDGVGGAVACLDVEVVGAAGAGGGVESDAEAVAEALERGAVADGVDVGACDLPGDGGLGEAEVGGGAAAADVGDAEGAAAAGEVCDDEFAALGLDLDADVGGGVEGVEDVVDGGGGGEVDDRGAAGGVGDLDLAAADAGAGVEVGEVGVAVEARGLGLESEFGEPGGGGVAVGKAAGEDLLGADDLVDEEGVTAGGRAGGGAGGEDVVVGAGGGDGVEDFVGAEGSGGGLEGGEFDVDVEVGGLLSLELEDALLGEGLGPGLDLQQLGDDLVGVEAGDETDAGGDAAHGETPSAASGRASRMVCRGLGRFDAQVSGAVEAGTVAQTWAVEIALLERKNVHSPCGEHAVEHATGVHGLQVLLRQVVFSG
ncbi:MAG TPA: hypothetical protein PL072_08560 [Phycisphaerales bacterium]|nr:hypothetical protein [Phycisphaerales bacterium]